jgi:hypothetical protein
MIDIIYIPTYDRVGSQITYDSLPTKWKEKTYLVVSPAEVHPYYQTIPCPVQGNGIAPVRKWIAEHGKGKRYAVLDDDIQFVYTRRDDEEGLSNTPLTIKQFDDMFDTMNRWMDEGYIHVACDVCWNPPTRNIDFRVNSRITTNIFYDGTKLPIQEIDWTSLDIAEDYYVNLQLLTRGYQNKVSLKYRTNPSATQSKGGCSSFRTLDVHNDNMKLLREKFPNFVQLREKITKSSGEWSNKPRLAATISWKKAYQSSQTSTLDKFLK